jgi:PPP family 3-phenylpropionic acid transporter
VLLAAALARLPVLAVAPGLDTARPRAPAGFEYGWVRGTGSAAFIAGTLAAGQMIAATGLESIVWMQAALLGAAALAALRVPEQRIAARGTAPGADLRSILRIPAFRALVVAAALVLGSHAMHDAFAAIRWSEAGVGPRMSSLLWSLAVAAEVIVFFLVGPALVDRLTPAGAIGLAAAGGVLRWAVMAGATSPAVYAAIQPLHGLTFALLHLACMRIIARVVPRGGEGTAQAIYVVGAGGMSALLTLGSGVLYARVGPGAFWAMAALCAIALPLALRLSRYPSAQWSTS